MLDQEHSLELAVSAYIRSMPVLRIDVSDAAEPESDRGLTERNSIGLLSNFSRPSLDAASEQWLGRCCDRERVRGSGLWNNNHVDENYEPSFLAVLKKYVAVVHA